MELNQQPANEARDTSEPGGSVRRRPTSGCRPTWGCRGFLLTCGVLYFIMTILATVKWSFWRPTAMDGVALFSNGQSSMRNLAIVVPTHSGDLEDAIGALELWPKVCSATTLHHMHLVVYYSGSAGDGVWNEDAIPNVARTGGRCFERTKAVFASLTKEENVYPKGPSVMFYKMFLDRDVARALEGYDALAIVEWDVVVAHPTSFEMLYKAAFFSSEEFWMKGSTLAGAEFHETAGVSEMWHILGHLNGNAIYNNTDPGFHEFVNFTLNRWQYQYPYDVALWATIADFPYSWPLWQRYSSKFVATQLIANVGFHDVSQPEVGMAVSRNTLFIHGSTDGGGGTTNHAVAHAKARVAAVAPDCTRACGRADKLGVSGVSTFCDASCLRGWSLAGPRFGGHGCGADEPSRFGEDCRRCYTSQEAALAEERRLSSPKNMGPDTGVHVVMCSTGSPPAAESECSDECVSSGDAVCDYRCGSGVYGDLHCNWRGLGRTCRFCFQDAFDAHLADEISKTNGSRVIMCDTHEPPLAIGSNPTLELGSLGKTEPPAALPSGAATEASEVDVASTALTEAEPVVDPAATVFSGNITHGEMCAFMVGYFAFLEETSVGVSSVLHFMPGMKVGIAAHPTDFDVFNRTLGKFPTVSVINASRVEHSAVHADKACGPGTRLIYYMEVGEVLSRPFTPKDTHSPRGDLIVSFTDAESGHQECDRRAKAADILLGFYPPCFTYGSDLILPAELNQQLRGIVRARTRDDKGGPGNDVDDDLTGDLATLAASHDEYASVHVPEVLASLAFAHNHDSIVFHNPREWSVDNLFVVHSIWDIPLVKPRFGCTYNMALSQQGYDLGKRMAQEFESFKLGLGKCEMGFRDVQPFELDLKDNQEFGVVGALQDMPDLHDFRVSIMYRTFNGDAKLFNMSVQSVIERFPSAHEVVVVVLEEDATVFKRILDGHRTSAPFPLHLVSEKNLMDGHVQQKYSKLRADLYTDGDYVLHLDSDGVLFEDIKYDHLFHLGKPVLPFRRYRSETTEGLQTMLCWQNGTSFAVGEEVIHEFSLFTNHVYPRSLYRAARRFIEEHHQKSLADFMSTRRGSCMHPNTMAQWTVKQRDRMFSDFNFLGAYLWYHMHDAVYWVAGDPLDTQPGDWRPDLIKFAWVCQADGRDAPKDAAGMKQLVADFRMVRNQKQCMLVRNHWKERGMKNPATRTKVDTSSEEWNQA